LSTKANWEFIGRREGGGPKFVRRGGSKRNKGNKKGSTRSGGWAF